MKILLVPNWGFTTNMAPEATVEAEYGDKVLKGSMVTLAHHTAEYRNCPAPCNAEVGQLPENATIVVSHIDLDTIGGCLALMGMKPSNGEFWAAAEFIDLNGPHHLFKFSKNVQDAFNAYWAWNFSQPRSPRITEVTDVTSVIEKHKDVLERILDGDESLLEIGKKWTAETTEKVEGCLIEEMPKMRIFATDDVFCSAAYYSPSLAQIVPVTLVLNTRMGSITVACADGSINARETVQALWGPEAGGHFGIAGSPRGKKMSLNDLVNARSFIKSKK
jgi:hypothetical protein